MKKIEKTTETIVKTIQHIYCDICESKIINNSTYYKTKKCIMCDRDICESCIGYVDYSGDYAENICTECYNIGTPYRKKIVELENEVEEVYSEWENICKQKKIKNENV